ncbi:MAG: JAB domain-containing protein, partial [Sphingobium sp.]
RGQEVMVPLAELGRILALTGACSLFVAHDHPSGDPRPSRTDIDTTRRIWRLARTLGVSLQDHMIFAGRQMFSFRANGLL